MASTEPVGIAGSTQTQIFQSPQKLKLILSLLLVLGTICVYSSITRAPFLNYDDAIHIADNPHVRAGLTWHTVEWAFKTSETSDWHPITWLSHALDCELFGMNPAGPHTVNLLLHATNAFLVFLILASGTRFVWRSFVVAALFALHPINVESVAWISERKDVLSMLFFLLALAAYGWYTRKPGAGRYLAVTVCYALALMSKAQVITFPFALLLLDYWPLLRFGPEEVGGDSDVTTVRIPLIRLISEKIPWFAMSVASAIITVKVESDATQTSFPFWVHFSNAAISYAKYVGKAFWPADLAVVYPHPGFAISKVAAAASLLLLVGVTSLVVIYRRRRPFFVGWFWFLGTLVPMIGLVQISVHAMADRYAYIPLLGIFVMVCWGGAEIAKSLRIGNVTIAVVTAAILLALGIGLHRQVGYWNDNLTLWAHTLAITQGNYTAEDNLATALIAQGRVEEAMRHFQRAMAYRPDDAMATINLATYLQMTGNYAAALEGYAKVLQSTKVPSLLITARINGGYAHYSLKEYDRAKQDFEAARNLQPDNWSAYRGLGLVAQQSGDLRVAVENYQKSVTLQPSGVGFLLLAQALGSFGHTDLAQAAEAQAVGMTRDLGDDTATVKQLLAK